MKIKNHQVFSLITLLHELVLKGKLSRQRSIFENFLINHHNEYIAKGILALEEDYALKDEEGKIYFDCQENEKSFFDERHKLLEEYFILELNESNKVLTTTISEIILEGEFDVPGDMAMAYLDWCDEAEKVLEYYNKIE